jgi:hypothetical protein
MRKFLLVYTFSGVRGAGNGRIFGSLAGPVTEEVIKGWEQNVKDLNPGFDHVAMTNIVELEA